MVWDISPRSRLQVVQIEDEEACHKAEGLEHHEHLWNYLQRITPTDYSKAQSNCHRQEDARKKRKSSEEELNEIYKT